MEVTDFVAKQVSDLREEIERERQRIEPLEAELNDTSERIDRYERALTALVRE